MSAVWLSMAFVVVGALLFAYGIQAHQWGLIAIAFICMVTAGIYGSKGSTPHGDVHGGGH
jgi:hypothetical protein